MKHIDDSPGQAVQRRPIFFFFFIFVWFGSLSLAATRLYLDWTVKGSNRQSTRILVFNEDGRTVPFGRYHLWRRFLPNEQNLEEITFPQVNCHWFNFRKTQINSPLKKICILYTFSEKYTESLMVFEPFWNSNFCSQRSWTLFFFADFSVLAVSWPIFLFQHWLLNDCFSSWSGEMCIGNTGLTASWIHDAMSRFIPDWHQ